MALCRTPGSSWFSIGLGHRRESGYRRPKAADHQRTAGAPTLVVGKSLVRIRSASSWLRLSFFKSPGHMFWKVPEGAKDSEGRGQSSEFQRKWSGRKRNELYTTQRW